MARLGTEKRPAIVRVQTQERVAEIAAICNEHGWYYVAGIEPHKTEDISDVEKLLNPPTRTKAGPKVGRNDPCPCGSGIKYKACCGSRKKVSP